MTVKAKSNPQAQALLLTRLTKLERGVPIDEKVVRVAEELERRDGIVGVQLLAVSADRTSAFLVVTGGRPSALKGLVGNDTPEIYRSFDDRTERMIARRFDAAFAAAARDWECSRHAVESHAVA